MRLLIAGATFALLLAHAAGARADDEEEARAAMRRGVAAFGRGEAEVALAEYATAERLAPRANAPYRYAAEALASLGRWPEAVSSLETYLEKNPNVSDAQEVHERIATIRAEHYPARVRIVANAEDANVAVDGESKGRLAILELPPGTHRVELSAPGRAPVTQDVSLVGDRETTLVFKFNDPTVTVVTPAIVAPATDTRGTMSPWRTAGWVGLGVGAAVVVTTVIVDTAALGPKISDYRSAADRGDTSARALHDQAKSLQTGVIVAYVTGGVLAGAGAALVLFAPSAPARATLRPVWAPGYAGMLVNAGF